MAPSDQSPTLREAVRQRARYTVGDRFQATDQGELKCFEITKICYDATADRILYKTTRSDVTYPDHQEFTEAELRRLDLVAES